MQSEHTSININKYISNTGICSRREADRLIATGVVTLNGVTAQLGNRVNEGDIVEISGKLLTSKPEPIYIAFNKPVGIICTTETDIKGNIITYINHLKRMFPIGRLDKDSEGLIFLTNDGDIVNKILRAGNNHQKEYLVKVDKPLTKVFLQKMASGVPILDIITQKCFIEQESTYIFRIILTQGLNRQIRRMCSYLGYEVKGLKRIRIMNVALADLPTGKWRNLSEDEILKINELVAKSDKTEKGSLFS
jgi:23S rRNA pseudouridine2604 synthase